MSTTERRMAALALLVIGLVAAAIAVVYGLARTDFLSHSTGYHHNRAIVAAVIALVAWIAAILVRPRSRAAAR